MARVGPCPVVDVRVVVPVPSARLALRSHAARVVPLAGPVGAGICGVATAPVPFGSAGCPFPTLSRGDRQSGT